MSNVVTQVVNSKANQRIFIREATLSDNKKLIALTEQTPMKGVISLRIDRRPNFFSLIRKRGDYGVLLAEVNKEVVGCIGYAEQEFFINGCKQKVHYICDFKVHPNYKKSRVTFMLLKTIHQALLQVKAKWLFSTIAFGNADVLPGFEGRLGFPLFEQLAAFVIYQLLPKKNSSAFADKHIQCVTSNERVRDFYIPQYGRYKFCPAFTNLEDCSHFSYIEEGKVKAIISVFDPGDLKQNVVIDFPNSVGLALGVLRLLKTFTLVAEVPRKNEPIRTLYISHFAFDVGCEFAFNKLLKCIRHHAFIRRFHFISISVHSSDSAIVNIIKPRAAFKFQSQAYLANMNKMPGDFEPADGDLYYEDYSLV